MKTIFVKTVVYSCLFAICIFSCSGVNKQSNNDSASEQALPRSTPEAENVSQKGINNYLDAVKESKQDLHSIMIVRNGKVIFEEWFGNYAANKLHPLWSVSKTYTATAIGFAVNENRLKVTDKVISFFPDKLPPEVSPYLQELEIRHLLTMSVGHDVNRVDQARRNNDWVQAFLSVPIEQKPGTVFSYNSMATYMLSAIIQKVTGEKLINYLSPRLFNPLGIVGAKWDESPQGINIGGWGLYVKTEDMAKLGQFILQKGKWNGVQLLPESWIEEATTAKIIQKPEITPEQRKTDDWAQGYCYQMWRCQHNAVRADGANGQYIIIFPEKDAVVAITANVPDMQVKINLVWDYLLPSFE